MVEISAWKLEIQKEEAWGTKHPLEQMLILFLEI